MERLVNNLVKMARDGEGKVLIAYNFKGELNVYEGYQVNYIDKNLQLGTIDLDIYSTKEDIKEELESMLED